MTLNSVYVRVEFLWATYLRSYCHGKIHHTLYYVLMYFYCKFFAHIFGRPKTASFLLPLAKSFFLNKRIFLFLVLYQILIVFIYIVCIHIAFLLTFCKFKVTGHNSAVCGLHRFNGRSDTSTSEIVSKDIVINIARFDFFQRNYFCMTKASCLVSPKYLKILNHVACFDVVECLKVQQKQTTYLVLPIHFTCIYFY